MSESQAFVPEDEALPKAHAALLRDLRQLEEATRASSGLSSKALTAHLVATRAAIMEHFRFEEQDGYMDKVSKREPRLERAIQQLKEEHRELTKSLDACIEQARTAPSLGDSVRDAVRHWIERIRQHEMRENQLVQEAFNWDIGTED
jgi:hypothetical protein